MVYDGFVSLIGGMDEGLDPSALQPTNYVRGLNVTNRGGLVKTRPAFKKICDLETGDFKGAFSYRLHDAHRIVYGHGAQVSVLRLDTLATANVGALSAADRFYFAQPDRYCVVQDDASSPVVIDEDAAYTGTNSIPVGSIMAYGHGRLFVVPRYAYDSDGNPTALNGRPYFLAGDLIKPYQPGEVLKFTEASYLNEGGGFALANESGYITGMSFIRNALSAISQGPLVVFGEYGVSAFGIDAERSTWNDIDIAYTLFTDHGGQSDRGVLPVNNDIIFRSDDGIRTITYSSQKVRSGLANDPVSDEVREVLALDDAEDRAATSMAYADGRAFMLSGGRDSDNCFRAIVSLDFSIASRLGQSADPAYDGIWTGLKFQQILSARYQGERTLLVIAKNGAKNELWRLSGSQDEYQDGSASPTRCRLYTRQYNFTLMGQRKRFDHLDVWVKDLRGSVDLTAYWRPDGYRLWNKCRTVTIASDVSAGGLPQNRYRVRVEPLAEVFDEATDHDVQSGDLFQFCIQWTGSCTIEKVRMGAVESPDEPLYYDQETANALAESANSVTLDDFAYTIGAS